MSRRIAVGADHAGVDLKDALAQLLRERGFEVHDCGTSGHDSVDYPDFAHAVCAEVGSGRSELGLLVCGTGLGMSMAANRHAGIRAALCAEPFSARMTRMHNDANVLCMGSRVVGPGLAEEILSVFVTTAFEGGRHARRVGKIELGAAPTG
ncbi:MAG: ribose 5-phosphate isomerase B [Deltaproteobacteria bacterium]|nr:ribose 5-phosphate isomerase B [Deltaproteobacteria bacterium]